MEIKFRQWTNDEYAHIIDYHNMWILYHIDLNKVEQFTGLTDKNGVEIYEGDIVSNVIYADGSKHIGRIVYDYSGYRIVTEDKSLILDLTELLVVIGNIHDNKELLEVKE